MSAITDGGLAFINASLIGSISHQVLSTTGAYPSGTVSVEAIDTPTLCHYTPNFSRMMDHLPHAVVGLYRMAKFGTLTHTIRRVDSGANWGLFTDTAGAGGGAPQSYPTNMGTRDIKVYVNYRYVPITESMTATPNDNWYRSRMKRVELKPGRKLVFKHKLQVHSREYLSYLFRYMRTIANSQAGNREEAVCSTWEQPCNFRKLGWLPTYLFAQRPTGLGGDPSDQPFCDTGGGAATQGLRPGMAAGQDQDLVLMGNTVQFIFDVMQYGRHILDAGGVPVGIWSPINRPLVRRSESVPIYLKGFSNVCGQDTVAQLLDCAEYPLSAPAGAARGRITQFAPPRFDTVMRPPRNGDSLWTPPDRPYPINVEQMPQLEVQPDQPLPLLA